MSRMELKDAIDGMMVGVEICASLNSPTLNKAAKMVIEAAKQWDDQWLPAIKPGDKVYWLHGLKIYRGTVVRYSWCEGQGAMYLELNAPTFRVNRTPTVHYTSCYRNRSAAEEYVEYLKKQGKTWPMHCDTCKLNEMRKEKT
jgi:hypothetical protein